MSLLIELGNTRVKASMLSKKSYEYLGSFPIEWLEEESLTELFSLHNQKFTRVFISSVGHSRIEFLLNSKIKSEFEIFPHVITTQPECCGVLNGYQDFKKLGVDRWLAILGACASSTMPTFIVDAGTALTIDVVIDKKHLGGLITPGLRLQHESLASGGENLSMTLLGVNDSNEGLLGNNTAAAIHGGCLYMTSAYINNLLADLEAETGRLFECVGTGGDFLTLSPLLDKPFNYIEDLTLIGMSEIINKV